MAQVGTPEIRIVPIDSLTPYANNPRRIPRTAVEQVAKSLQRYGWQQPLVVDGSGVVVVGHTRLEAARSLGMTEVPVHVAADLTPAQLDAYRVVDNRSGEYSDWDNDLLVAQLRETTEEFAEEFFPDVSLDVQQVDAAVRDTASDAESTASDIAAADAVAAGMTKIKCPSCFEVFDVATATLRSGS